MRHSSQAWYKSVFVYPLATFPMWCTIRVYERQVRELHIVRKNEEMENDSQPDQSQQPPDL